MKKIIAVTAFLFVSHFGFAQSTYKADAEKYMEVSGQMKIFEYLTQDIIQNIPEDKKADFSKDLAGSLRDLQSKMADMYMEEFSHEDIKALIKIYETPIGKKLYEKNKVLYDKGQDVGMEWGMGLQSIMMKYMEM